MCMHCSGVTKLASSNVICTNTSNAEDDTDDNTGSITMARIVVTGARLHMIEVEGKQVPHLCFELSQLQSQYKIVADTALNVDHNQVCRAQVCCCSEGCMC
jgi:hypothetical protein